MIQLALVVPCYNEEAVLRETALQLHLCLDKLAREQRISPNSKIYFIDDGSRDHTWPMIEELAKDSTQFVGIKLSRNRGHQNALLAGLLTAEGDAVVTIDADLQDDISVIPAMLAEFEGGRDVVYGVRRNRDTDSLYKRTTALGFYRFMHLMGAEVIDNHGDFRLLSRRAIDHLQDYREVNVFLRGIVPQLGYPSAKVYYDRHERKAGESKYPTARMLSFALDGITSFSMMPLRIIAVMGMVVFLLTALMSAWVLGVAVFTDNNVPGWASTVLPAYFLGGVQILCLGVIGEYLGKMYVEIKARPRFIIEKRTNGQ